MSHYDPRERSLSKVQKAVQKVFPERQIMLRSGGTLRSVRLSTISQIALTAASVGAACWIGFSSFMYVNHEQILTTKQEEVLRARSAYKTLLAQVEIYRDRISDVADNLERNHSYALTLVEQNADLDQKLQAVQGELASSEAQREQVARQKERLVGHLQKLKSELQGAAVTENNAAAELALASFDQAPAGAVALQRERTAREREALRTELARLEAEMVEVAEGLLVEQQVDAIELELRRVILQRDMANNETSDLQQQVALLKQQLADMENTQLALFERFSILARDRIGELEGALKKTGLDVDRLLQRKDGGSTNQGGPFIPLEMGAWDALTLRNSLDDLNGHVARWNSLESLADSLPLGQPVRDYYVSSTFGARKDPLNGRVAMHEGLDMAGPIGLPVFAGGPGKVVYAGWRGRYGRLVEIDHGFGLKTRYAHLHKIFVKKGEVVDRASRVGLLGSSGRSTGPHLHYEVIYLGKPLNPDKFIKAGANVFKG
ncbi:MAG: peptidoglycan DD-metalloendopeptidase family protein [Rhodospirillaceae bacterium]